MKDLIEELFKNDEVNNNLRFTILRQFVSQVMTDRERANLWGLPEGCRMRENAKILSPEKLVCGQQVWIGEGSVLDASGGLEIGEHTSIGLNSYVWSHSSMMSNIMYSNYPGNEYIKRDKTIIGKGCFIGGPSVIFPGITIGDQCIIMPMSVVMKDVPTRSVVMGNPARVINRIDEAYIQEKLDELKNIK